MDIECFKVFNIISSFFHAPLHQLLAHGRWFSLGTPDSSTTKTGWHDIAEILLKVALNTKNQSINQSCSSSNLFTPSKVASLKLD
jgi:hypothetical protein